MVCFREKKVCYFFLACSPFVCFYLFFKACSPSTNTDFHDDVINHYMAAIVRCTSQVTIPVGFETHPRRRRRWWRAGVPGGRCTRSSPPCSGTSRRDKGTGHARTRRRLKTTQIHNTRSCQSNMPFRRQSQSAIGKNKAAWSHEVGHGIDEILFLVFICERKNIKEESCPFTYGIHQ